MVNWVGDGNIRAYDETLKTLDIDKGKFVAPQTIKNTKFITRIQHKYDPAAPGAPSADQIVARATFNFIGTEVNSDYSGDPDWTRWATMFIATNPAWDDNYVPSVDAIIKGTSGTVRTAYRGQKISGSTGGPNTDATFLFYGLPLRWTRTGSTGF